MDPSNFQIFMDAVLQRIEQQEVRAATTNEPLLQVVHEQRSTRQDNQEFQPQQRLFNQRLLDWIDRQEKCNERVLEWTERQDRFNIIFLDEIRGLKKDVRELADLVLKQHDARLKRPEDLMDGFMRKAS